ncbi:MAG TPA: C25 family cysteine peptidase, partial [Bacteroidales bacterium]
MKKLYIHFVTYTGLFALLVLGNASVAQEWNAISSNTATAAQVELLTSIGSRSTLHVTIPGFSLEQVMVQGREEEIVRLSGAQPLQEPGAPDLVSVTASLLIPATAEMGFTVTSSKFIDYQDISIAPSLGERMRTTNTSATDYSYGAAYSRNEFFPGNMALLNRPYIVRDYRGQSANIFPFQYNPITHTLRVYYDITISIEQVGNQGENQMSAKMTSQAADPEFQQVYNKLFLNQPQTKYAQVSENGRMLIIAYGEYIPAMKSFVEWKNTRGIPTEIVDVASIGDANSIKQYVSDYYYSKGLTYLLLVGDNNQVPTITLTNGGSDNSYAYVAGDDHYPDLFVGRFSAENEAQVKTQADRTINYEKYPDAGANWYENATGIGSELGPGDDGEYDFQHIRNMMGDLLKYNYTKASELYDGSQGGADASGNPDARMVVDNINNGTGLMMYIGHGSSSLWSTTQFSRNNVADLRNAGKYPFIWSVACGNGDFVNGTCLAEDLLRASYKGQPTGAIAALMASGEQSWYPPMEAQDEMVDLLVESKTGNIKRTFGGISMSGCMKMMD